MLGLPECKQKTCLPKTAAFSKKLRETWDGCFGSTQQVEFAASGKSGKRVWIDRAGFQNETPQQKSRQNHSIEKHLDR